MNWFPKKKILVPVDFSEESLAAVDTVQALVDSPDHVVVVHVLQDMSPAEPREIWHAFDENARRENALRAIRERLSNEKYAQIRVEVLFGDPGHEITALAQREKAELIVLPSRGRTGIKRLLIGSVAERVVQLAHCPVLVLRS
jgi:nucleotide-binding universal stress UspA family protein